MSEHELTAAILALQDEGAHNVNLVTPTPYAEQLVDFLRALRPKLRIPVVYNCGGYESVESLRALEGLVDIYLPDFKYADEERAARYSGASDYPAVARDALCEMLRQVGKPVLDADGIMQRGVIVRHLVLPGGRADSIAVLRLLKEQFGTDAFLLSLMSQYTPDFAARSPYQELHRRVTTFEYDAVLREAQSLGFDGYFQARSSATAAFTPEF
jgi:putative pyruvate formate lyase activating enzyme